MKNILFRVIYTIIKSLKADQKVGKLKFRIVVTSVKEKNDEKRKAHTLK